MKKITTIFGLILSISLILTSCGGSSTESTDSAESTETESGEVAEEESSSDCEQFLEDYEAFADSYIEVLEKMKADPTDASLMSEYTEMMNQTIEMQNGAANCTDPEFAAKLTEIAVKITNAAAGM
jgi:hypothetical protein